MGHFLILRCLSVDSGYGGIERDTDIIDEGDVVIAGHDINFLDQMIRRCVSGMSTGAAVRNLLKGYTGPVYSFAYSLDIILVNESTLAHCFLPHKSTPLALWYSSWI